MQGSGLTNAHTSVTKTYSRKRGRTRSSSSPSGLFPSTEQDLREPELKRKKTTPAMYTVTSGKTQIEDEDDHGGQSTKKRLKNNKSSRSSTPSAPSVHVSTRDSLSLAQSQRNFQREDKIKMSLTSEISSEKPLTRSLSSLAHRQMPTGSSNLNGFKRTNSQLQKENVLSRPNLLASPFHINHASSSKTHRPVEHISERSTPTSKMARRPSAGVPNAHSSASISFRRRPSGSHALQQKALGNHDWLVPPSQHFQPSNPLSQVDSELGMDHQDVQDINVTFSSFSPQCYSTPHVSRRFPIEVAPTTPVFVKPSRLSADNQLDTIINGGAGSVTTMAQDNPETSNDVTCLGTTSLGSRKLIHLPHDSIFSSFDFSTSAAGIEPDSTGYISRRGNITPQGPASSHILPGNPTSAIEEPEGEELQNMFSVLGLGEETKSVLSQNSGMAPDDIPLEEATVEDHASVHQKRKLRPAPPTNTGVEDVEKPGSQQPRKRSRRIPKHRDKQSSTGVLFSHPPAPRYGSRIDDEPLVAGDDEDDELLLTSKGWDWVPPASCMCVTAKFTRETA